jgi:hypothetical protein
MCKRLLLLGAIAATLVLAASASATPTGSVTFSGSSCTTSTTTFAASIGIYPANAFTPLFVTNTDTGTFAGVLLPHTIVLNGETLVSSSPGLDKSALSGDLVTCTFMTSRGTFEVTGILAPTVP